MMVVDRNMWESHNFNVNLIKVLINVHLLVNELWDYQNFISLILGTDTEEVLSPSRHMLICASKKSKNTIILMGFNRLRIWSSTGILLKKPTGVYKKRKTFLTSWPNIISSGILWRHLILCVYLWYLFTGMRYKPKVVCSIPDDFNGIFYCHNPSGRTMALGSTQPLTEISTRNNSWWGKGGRCVQLTTLPPPFADCLETLEPQPPGTLTSCPNLYRDSFIFAFFPGKIQWMKWQPIERNIGETKKYILTSRHGDVWCSSGNAPILHLLTIFLNLSPKLLQSVRRHSAVVLTVTINGM